MPETTARVVNTSSDVRIVRQGQDPLAILRAAKPWDIRADISVNIGNQVIFQGFNSNIPLVGRLNLTQRGYETAMRAMGAIGVSQKVKIEAYGQSLDLNRAIARFNGPLANPTLDIDANKNVQGSMVGVRVTGTASS
ncbi:translocation/assembly module TamB domain-containing protein, partial [Acinetobacter baumannii]